jgi:acyl-CoA thioesterase I
MNAYPEKLRNAVSADRISIRIVRGLFSITMVMVVLYGAVDCRTLQAAQKVTRVACAGDSITAGTYGNVYPDFLQSLLGATYEVKNFGVEASTLLASGAKPFVDQPEFSSLTAWRPDIVVIMLGTNDSKAQDWRSSARFVADYAALIAKIRKSNPKVRIYVCTPPTVVADAWGIRGQVIATEVCSKIKAAAKNVKLIDVHAAFKGKAGLHSDGVHPNEDGARLIAETVRDALVKGNAK